MDDAENKTIEQSVGHGVDDHNLYRLIMNQQKIILQYLQGRIRCNYGEAGYAINYT